MSLADYASGIRTAVDQGALDQVGQLGYVSWPSSLAEGVSLCPSVLPRLRYSPRAETSLDRQRGASVAGPPGVAEP